MHNDALWAACRAIREAIDARRLARAVELCAHALGALPSSVPIHLLAAEVALRQQRQSDALMHLTVAERHAGQDLRFLVNCAALYLQCGARSESLGLALQSAHLQSPAAEVNDSVAALLSHHDEPGRALPFALRAVEIEPNNVAFRFNLAMIQRMAGQFSAAEENLDRVVAVRPHDFEAHYARSGLRRQTREANHVAELERVIGRAAGHSRWIPAGFALAKELEDLGEYERAFAALQRACKAQRAIMRYDVASDIAVLEALVKHHDKAALDKARSDCPIDECVFVIGLPRSGTTLIDRVLASHPSISAAGELKAFPEAIIGAVGRDGQRLAKLNFVNASLAVDFDALGPAYLAATRPRTGVRPKFTDKLPTNYLYAGLIHAALPKARFIAVRRDPMDVCYAMYKTLFVGAYPFSYDLEDLGRYYVAWNHLMNHWQQTLGDAWLAVRYEDLVANPRAVAERMIAHCGLPWHEGCLDFHKLDTAVTTASAVQVRQPIYGDSVGRWRRYSQQLAPLISYFEAHGILPAMGC